MTNARSTKLPIIPTTALALATLALAAIALVQNTGPALPAPATAGSVAAGGAGVRTTAAETAKLVTVLQARVQAQPTDGAAYAQLGAAFLQRGRETADPGYSTRAEATLTKALELRPENPLAFRAMGTLALTRHRFDEALQWGELARQAEPGHAEAYGIIGDALLELGRYPQAFDAFQQMMDRRPDRPSYARIAYARELRGDIPGAIEAMASAAAAGDPAGEGAAWAWVQLGALRWTYQGDLAGTERDYYTALMSSPGYAPALAGLAQVAAARGDLAGAIAQAQQAATTLPLPSHVTLLGDLLRTAGRPDEAAQQDALVRAIHQLAVASGANTDLETALFEADRGEQPQAAVAMARAAHTVRPGVQAADVLAWALFRAGETGEARSVMEQALALGSRDPLVHYHAGKIALAAGDRPAARQHFTTALDANAHFSLRYADDARAMLQLLTEGGLP